MRWKFPFTTIWERYFFKELTKVFALFLFGFYSLYVLIDYSTHSRSFQTYNFGLQDILKYYGYEFAERIDVLIPFAILIACIKTLSSLNKNNELVALMVGGIPLKRLLKPFMAFGLFFVALIYFNIEFIQPQALSFHNQLDHKRNEAKHRRHHQNSPIQQMILDDQSSLIYRNYDPQAEQLEDVYWVRSIDDIYRIHFLKAYTEVPTGITVEHLVRNKDGTLVVADFDKEKLFPGIRFDKAKLRESVTQPKDLSLSVLKSKLPEGNKPLSEKEAKLLTTYHYKLAMPWLCLIAVMAPAPFCIRFSRSMPIFLIYSLSLMGLVVLYLTMDAAVVLGERQVVEPLIAIWAPLAAFLAFFGLRYAQAIRS